MPSRSPAAAFVPFALAALAALDAAPAQSEAAIVQLAPAVCAARTGLLETAREQVRLGQPAPALAQALRAEVERAARGVVAAVGRDGGTVARVLFSPPAVVVEGDAGLRARLAARADVLRVEPLRSFGGNTGDATGTSNHNAAFVHTVHGLRGTGQVLALVDSGIELRFLGGSTPHPAFLDGAGNSRIVRTWSTQGATLPDLSDQNGHGTGVGSVAVGRRWNGGLAADGFAPAASVASYRVTTGSSTQTTNADLAMAYGQVLLDVIGGLRIGVLNCSFSGSPDPLAVDQRALDELVLYGDVVAVTSAGKLTLPPNFDFRPTADSQAATNGLAVGAVTKNAHAVAPFSSFGPLHGDGERVYPDLAAVGKDVHVADRAGPGTIVVDGTSYSAPMVAGTAMLVRQARPDLDAAAVKAILLGTTTDLRASNPGLDANHFGRGLLRSDHAVSAALAAHTGFGNGDPDAAWIERGSTAEDGEATVSLDLPAATTISATLVWLRSDTAAAENPDLDLDVRGPGGALLARGNLPRNLYERVVFTTDAAGSHDFVVSGRRVDGDDAAWTLLVSTAAGLPRSPAVTELSGACAGTGVDLAAQLVLPAAAAAGFGGARTNKPLADVPLTLQAAYDTAQVPAPRTVRALALRRAGQEGGTAALAVRVRVTLGYTAHPPDALTTSLASNFLAAPAPLVAFDGWLDLPPTEPAPAAGDFDFVIPLSPAFALDAALGNPLVQLEVLGNGSGNAPQPIGFDAVAVTTGTSRGALVQVTGSPFALPVDQRPVIAFSSDAPRGVPPRMGFTGEPRIAATSVATLFDAREGTLAALTFGAGGSWLGYALPLGLGAWGAPGCVVLAAPEEVAFVVTDSVGQARVELPLPGDTGLLGVVRRAQFFVFDPAANAAGVVASDAVELLLGG